MFNRLRKFGAAVVKRLFATPTTHDVRLWSIASISWRLLLIAVRTWLGLIGMTPALTDATSANSANLPLAGSHFAEKADIRCDGDRIASGFY